MSWLCPQRTNLGFQSAANLLPRPFPVLPNATVRSQSSRRNTFTRHNRRTTLASSTARTAEARTRPGEKKGFVEEMRFVAMRLHTKDQAPKEGGREASQNPLKQWQPTREGYLRFLAESKAVYDTLEKIVAEAPLPELARFRDTGLERAGRLQKDIDWFQAEHGLTPPELSEDGPGRKYSRLLEQLAKDDPQAFLCHFYNVYFAHTAGGRMIGTKIADMILERKELEFYKYDGDYKPMLEAVRDTLNDVAEGWTREQKDRCLQETETSFSYSGDLLRTITA